MKALVLNLLVEYVVCGPDPPPSPPSSSADQSKLEREVRVCRMLRHESIVRLHYVFKESNINYLLFDL